MRKQAALFIVLLSLLFSLHPAVLRAGSCNNPLPARLVVGEQGVVTLSAAYGLNVRGKAGQDQDVLGQMRQKMTFDVLEGPVCLSEVYWWRITETSTGLSGWIAEGADGVYFVEPLAAEAPTVTPPVELPVPPVIPVENPASLQDGFSTWDWQRFIEGYYVTPPDPLTLQLPDRYAGDLPVPPVDLDRVRFVADAGLNSAQRALLAQNGFVVVPAGIKQFDIPYRTRKGWDPVDGNAYFVTTDALLHSLHLVSDQMLTQVEKEYFYELAADTLTDAYQAAEQQAEDAVGTPLETPAKNAQLYLAVALGLLLPETAAQQISPDISADIQPVLQMATQAAGRLAVPFLDDYQEDFSQYRPRGHYAGDPLLESYFRAMMWMGRLTFRAKSASETQTALLILRALQNGKNAYAGWQSIHDMLTFLIGPVDDLGPQDYAPLAEQVFGKNASLESLGSAKLAEFQQAVGELPGPRINSIVLPLGTTAGEVDKLTRGFRLFGQRFTFDGYVMQQLIYPEVGTANNARALPSGLDVAAALGSDTAYLLSEQAGAATYAGYIDHMAALREQVNTITSADWMQNFYGGWLWTLQPLWVRDPDLTPPMMQTEAWKRKDLHSGLASWTELKHDTLLYTEQPMGGLGGGGEIPPITSCSYVEPNPLVFSRIAVVAASISQRLTEHGIIGGENFNNVKTLQGAFYDLAVLAARLAEMARKEIAGEPLTDDELLYLQEYFGGGLWYIRYQAEFLLADPPDSAALVADVASNPDLGKALQQGVGDIDYIYVITNSPNGLQLTRGAVFSYYEFEQDIDRRMTDDEWRALVDSGQTPPRPDWVSAFFSK